MMIGYSYLYKHNPNIDWQKGQWEFTRYPDTCTSKVCKIRDVEARANKLHLEMDISRFLLLDDIGDEDPDNHILSLVDTTDPGSYQQAIIIATILNNRDQYRNSDCEDIKTWKTYVPEWLHEYGNVFSKYKLERMPLQKLYNYTIDFIEGTKLSKPAKVYPLFLAERNTLNTWINKELRKDYIHPCKKAKLQARIKPTALCSVIDKENSIEFLLDFPTLLIQLLHGLCTTFPHLSCDMLCDCDTCDVTLSCTPLCVVSLR